MLRAAIRQPFVFCFLDIDFWLPKQQLHLYALGYTTKMRKGNAKARKDSQSQ